MNPAIAPFLVASIIRLAPMFYEPRGPHAGPSAHHPGSHLFAISQRSQKEVAALLQVQPQSVQRTEKVAIQKLRLALEDEPDVVVQHDPALAARHGLKPSRLPASRLTFGGHYMTQEQREQLSGMRRRARWWEYAAEAAGCPEDAAEAREVARAIREEIADLSRRIALIP